MNRRDLLTELTTRITAISMPHPLRVGIDGVDASGKTTLADALAGAISGRPVIRASIDRFHNPRAVRYRLGPDSPEGYYRDSFDLDALKAHLLAPLGRGGDRVIQTGLFDFRTDSAQPDETFLAPPDAILLLDGVFLHRPELSGWLDFTIFLQVSFETVLARAAERDRGLLGSGAKPGSGTQQDSGALPGSVSEIHARYLKRYIPAQQQYLETCRPVERADVVIVNDDPENPQIQ